VVRSLVPQAARIRYAILVERVGWSDCAKKLGKGG
jgi:hypothetical protein